MNVNDILVTCPLTGFQFVKGDGVEVEHDFSTLWGFVSLIHNDGDLEVTVGEYGEDVIVVSPEQVIRVERG